MLTHFCLLYPKPLTEKLEEVFEMALAKYTDNEVLTSGHSCLEECEFFPKPSDVIKRIKASKKDVKHSQGIRERYRCPKCKNDVDLLYEGVCLECHSGAPLSAGRSPVVRKDWSRDRNYIMQDQTRCQECGNVGMAIKEPADSGEWQCRECYTSLTKDEISQRFHDLMYMTGDKTYGPGWVKELK